MEKWELAIICFFGIAAVAFALMPPTHPKEDLLTTHKVAGTTGTNGKYEIEANGAVLAAATGLKNEPPAPQPKPTPPKPEPKPRPIFPIFREDGQSLQDAVIGPETPAAPTVQTPNQGQNCPNGMCQPTYRRGIFRR